MAAAARIDGQGVSKTLPMRLVIVLLAAALLVYPLVFSGAFYRDIGVTFLLAAISASAWNIVGGYAGQVSVGHSMFFGLGAYIPLLFYTHWAWPPMAAIPIAVALAIGLSLLIGMPTFRLTGHYFSMATIAVAELIRIFTGTWDFVGAAIGLQGPELDEMIIQLLSPAKDKKPSETDDAGKKPAGKDLKSENGEQEPAEKSTDEK